VGDLPGVTVRPLSADEALAVPDLWNASWERRGANPYPLSDTLWRERLASRHHRPSLLLGAFAGGELVGYAHGKLPVSPWQPAGVAWVSSLAVAPGHQRRGVGTALLTALLDQLAASGAVQVRFGSDADHLLPGVPSEAPPATWRLLRRYGARFAAFEHDLHLDLRLPLPEAPLPPGWRLRDDDPQGALGFVQRVFPGRWAEELADYLAAGATAFTVERTADHPDGASAGAEGFCVAFQGGERLTSPGLHWSGALARELPGGKPGGIGPLGLSPEVRGGGVGLAMVRGAAATLQRRGVTDVIINWTTLGAFYGRLGARAWRTYQRAEAPLPASGTRGAPAGTSGGER
jgi:predicted N-acetyltransferase YhbS